jgi:hypothetical protein
MKYCNFHQPEWWKPGSDPDWLDNNDVNDLPVESRRFEVGPLMLDYQNHRKWVPNETMGKSLDAYAFVTTIDK